MPRSSLLLAVATFTVFPTITLAQAGTSRASQAGVSAPVTNIRYELTFDSTTAATRTVKVAMTFDVAGPQPVLLSLPTWTPGAYEISNFARKVARFAAAQGGQPRRWDKIDPDTWRVRPAGAGSVTVTFDFLADSLDNAMAWARSDFLMVNGTNVFPFPEGRSLAFPATLTVRTQPGWLVATGMRPGGASLTYRESNYHDLVDMPLFIGRIDVDSQQISGKWARLATWPAGRFGGEPRALLWRQMQQFIPAQAAVFGVTPWDTYTTLIMFVDEFPGGSALEHQNSHVGIYTPQLMGHPILSNITSHEVFHAWNVKRLRPAEMVPYGYAAMQPTTLLWISEGFTNYYADLSEVRGGSIDSTGFLENTMGHMQTIANTPPVSVEDASLSVWIHPQDGTDYIYYDKGSIIGLLLDIQIRDGSDNRRSLDDVMRELYQATAVPGRGFTSEQFWAAVGRAAGRPLTAFYETYVDGSAALPFDTILPLAGMRLVTETTRVPRMGVQTNTDSTGSQVVALVPGGAFEAAGVRVGDYLISTGGIDQRRDVSGEEFRRQFANREGAEYPIVVLRDGQRLTLTGRVRLAENSVTRLEYDAGASPKAARIRSGMLRGITGQ